MLPGVITVQPNDKSTEVSLEEKVIIGFDQKLDFTTVDDYNVRVINCNNGESYNEYVKIELDESCKNIIISPVTTWPYKTDMKVEISNIVSWNLERMFGTYELSFETTNPVVDDNTDNNDGFPDVGDVTPTVPPVQPVAPEYFSETIFNVNGTYIVDKKIVITFNGYEDDGYDKKELMPDTIIHFNDYDYKKVCFVENEGFDSADEAYHLGEIKFLSTVENTRIFKNKLLIDLKPLYENKDLIGGKEYFIFVNEVPLVINKTEFIKSEQASQKICLLSPIYGKLESVMSYFAMIGMESFIDKNDVLYRLYENSKLAEWMVTEAENTENIKFDPPDMAVIKYVEEKTKYDIMLAKYVSFTSGASRKKLDDFEVEYGFSIKDLLSMLDRLKKSLGKWEDILTGNNKAKMMSFVRGSQVDQMPDFIKNRSIKGW